MAIAGAALVEVAGPQRKGVLVLVSVAGAGVSMLALSQVDALWQASVLLVAPQADFTSLDLAQVNNLHVHWGTKTAGLNDTGVGGLAAALAGLDESVEGGFPAISSLSNNAHRVDLATMGADVLLGDVLIGILYTDTNLPASIPEPGDWGLIPEPASGGLFALGALLLGRWRRTA